VDEGAAMQFNCLGCGKLFECDPGPSGGGVSCPYCCASFSAPQTEHAITTVKPPLSSAEEGILKSLPAGVESCGPQQLGQMFAPKDGIDLNERFEQRVTSESEATKQLRKWQWEMPEVQSAYQPSGALPKSAVMCLLLGSVVGCVAGLFAGVLVGSAGVALAVVFASIGVFDWPFFRQFVSFFLLVLTIFGAYFATGWVSAWCTTRLGEWGKNRNIVAAVLLSVIASIMPVIFAWGCYYKYIGSEPLLEKRAIRVRVLEVYSDPISVVSTVFGLVIAPAVAGFFAANRVGAAKFCENCKSFMRVTGPKSLRAAGKNDRKPQKTGHFRHFVRTL
jgi:hypothetical protein